MAGRLNFVLIRQMSVQPYLHVHKINLEIVTSDKIKVFFRFLMFR